MTALATPVPSPPSTKRSAPPVLYNGDRMTQPEFHRAYEAMPAHFKAELIGGVVFVASPLGVDHSDNQVTLAGLLFVYATRTPGVQPGDNATVILGDGAEPQPDLHLRVLPAYGGLTRVTPPSVPTGTRFVEGPPELVIEIAHATRAIDLHAKRADYAAAGVPEYMVYVVADGRLRWFDLANDAELLADPDGVVRSRQFPGLWIDAAGLAARDFARLGATLDAGLATADHAAFVRQLAERNANGPQT